MVRVPMYYAMGGMLDMLYGEWAAGGEGSAAAGDGLRMIISNMMCVTSTPNGFYHRALEMVAACYAAPDLLRDGTVLKDDAAALVNAFLEWRKDYDAMVGKDAAGDAERMRQEEIAEKAVSELSGGNEAGR